MDCEGKNKTNKQAIVPDPNNPDLEQENYTKPTRSLMSAIFAHSHPITQTTDNKDKLGKILGYNLVKNQSLQKEITIDTPPLPLKALFKKALSQQVHNTILENKQKGKIHPIHDPAATEREILELTENRMVEEEVEFDSVNNKLVAAKLESYTNCNGDLKSSKAYQEKMIKRRTQIREALNVKKFIILPDDAFKSIWSMLALLLLLYACIVTPYRCAFTENDPIEWIIMDSIIDICFLVDLVLNFFYAFYDENEELVLDRKRISINYLKSWFIIDIIAILPVNYMVPNQNKDYSGLSRLARLPRLYRLLKLTKVLRTIRVCREKNAWMGKIEQTIPSLSIAGERLLAFIMIVLVMCHVTACLWYLLAQIEGIHPESWVIRYGLQDASNYHIYTAAFYYTVTTITTVGYGDISPYTSSERWFGVITMMIGVMSYSFAISSLSSMLSTSDTKAQLQAEALETLDNIDLECNLETKLFLELRRTIAMKFKKQEYIKNRDNLMHILPRKLRRLVNSSMHARLVQQVSLFSTEGQGFLNYLATVLKPKKYGAEEIICNEGEDITGIYFMLSGSVEYVLPQFNDTPYMSISKDLHFGDLEIVNSMLKNQILHGKRLFTAKAKEDCEILVLSITDLIKLFHRYEGQAINIFEGSDMRLKYTLEQKKKLENGLKQRQRKIHKLFISKKKRKSVQSRVNYGIGKYQIEGTVSEESFYTQSEGHHSSVVSSVCASKGEKSRRVSKKRAIESKRSPNHPQSDIDLDQDRRITQIISSNVQDNEWPDDTISQNENEELERVKPQIPEFNFLPQNFLQPKPKHGEKNA